MKWARLTCIPALLALPLPAQRLADFTTPQPLPPGSVLVVGFLGGFEDWNDSHRSLRKLALDLRSSGVPNIFAETAGNHHRRTALRFIERSLDTNRNGHIDPDETAVPRIILCSQSWGGAAVVKTAWDLNRLGVPVLLTVQVDSVGAFDAEIPPNVLTAANFYQHDPWTLRGRTAIYPADPSRTRILSNFLFSYGFGPVPSTQASWARRTLGGSHVKMELDPRVQQLIRTQLQ